MKKNIIKKIYLDKISLIKKYNRSYFDENKSLVTDDEYDQLKIEIIRLEKKNKFLNSKDSPSIKVGYEPSKSFSKSKHKVPMLSLGNAFSKDDLVNFEKKITNYLSVKNDFEMIPD